MKNNVKIMCTILLLLAGGRSFAQSNWNYLDRENAVSKDSITKKGFTLILLNNSSAFDTAVGKRLIEVFFKVYPKEAKMYNRKTLKKVFFIIDTGYKGVAATSGGIVRFNPKWFDSHPKDIDVVTHEVMHIVQSYGRGAGPGWLTEGIADYVRYKLGVDNAGAGWSLPEFKTSQSYTNAYRVTARFLAWAEKHHKKGLVKKLDAALRAHTYTSETWTALTGKTVDELWNAYALNPVI
jgi:hypothetical protein